MSISRKNWSALSSLTRQWTVEDEEEVERERRRRVKSSTSTAEPEADVSPPRKDTSSSGLTSGTDKSSGASPGLSSEEQMQVDFVEMLHVRDEKRKKRHMETLRRQKEEDDGNEIEATGGGGGGEKQGRVQGRGGEAGQGGGGGGDEIRGVGARVQPQGNDDEEQDSVFKPQPKVKASSYSITINSNNIRTSSTSRQPNNGELSRKDPDPKSPPRPARKFVSSVSISLDKSPSVSGCTSPMSPCSPTGPRSPQGHWSSPCKSPPARGPQSPVQNGHRREVTVNGNSTSESFEQSTKPAFITHSSRTASFRMIRKKEEESSPLQRSASMRTAFREFEPTTDRHEDKDNTLPFQRNSRLRTSSKSIQEKMERLAQAAQKTEPTRSQDVTQRTLFRLDEVSRKRGIFEKEQQTQNPSSAAVSRQEFRGFASGMSGRVNRWINKSNQTGPPHSPADLRQVDISSKKSLFENREENSATKNSPGKF